MFKNQESQCPVKGCKFIVKSDSIAEAIINFSKHYTSEHDGITT